MSGPEAPGQANGSAPEPAGGPPLGSLFELTGRPAPGLYAGGWLLALLSVALLGVAFAAAGTGNASGATLLATVAFGVWFVATALGAGYQAVARRATRPANRYRGPSPFIVFAAVFGAANAVIGAVVLLAHVEPAAETGLQALLSVGVVVPLYAMSVWFLVVREGGLRWEEMGWPVGAGWGRAAGSFVYGAVLTVPVVVVTAVLAALLAAFLKVTPPPILPLPTTPSDIVLDVVVAVVLAPLGEELFFRGFAQTAWTRDLGWSAGLVRSALFFALVHAVSTGGADFSEAARLAVVAAVVRLPVAFALGWVFTRTGSVLGSMGMHATFNGLMLLFAALPTPT